eukprot:TRINITY_DN2050_c0_g2_i1.p1 TRINITY_DN2050_c0_g2~~TRINITY_DN2050_c0_g2_i1.p1  ORF type:complete len:543 (+),score=171.64 TRINITY_DN2050_c0_g2_i1:76-1704(+)
MELWGSEEPPLSLAEVRESTGAAGSRALGPRKAKSTKKKPRADRDKTKGGRGGGGGGSRLMFDSDSYIKLVSHSPTLLHNSVNIVAKFLRAFDKSVLCTQGVISIHKAAKVVQRRIRLWIARKHDFKQGMLELWRQHEREQWRLAVLAAKKRDKDAALRTFSTGGSAAAAQGEGAQAPTPPHEPPTSRPPRRGRGATVAKAADKKRIEKEETPADVKAALLSEHVTALVRRYCMDVGAWSEQWGARCRRLTQSCSGFIRQIGTQRDELENLLKQKARAKGIDPLIEAEIPAMQQFLVTLKQQRAELVVQLFRLPSRPIMDWRPSQAHLAVLLTTLKKQQQQQQQSARAKDTVKTEAEAPQPPSSVTIHESEWTPDGLPAIMAGAEGELPPIVQHDSFPTSRPPSVEHDGQALRRPRYVIPKDQVPKLAKRPRRQKLPKIVSDQPCEIVKRPGGWWVLPVINTRSVLTQAAQQEEPTTPEYYPAASNHTAYAKLPRPPQRRQRSNPWNAADNVHPDLVARPPRPKLRQALLADQPYPVMRFGV